MPRIAVFGGVAAGLSTAPVPAGTMVADVEALGLACAPPIPIAATVARQALAKKSR